MRTIFRFTSLFRENVLPSLKSDQPVPEERNLRKIPFRTATMVALQTLYSYSSHSFAEAINPVHSKCFHCKYSSIPDETLLLTVEREIIRELRDRTISFQYFICYYATQNSVILSIVYNFTAPNRMLTTNAETPKFERLIL